MSSLGWVAWAVENLNIPNNYFHEKCGLDEYWLGCNQECRLFSKCKGRMASHTMRKDGREWLLVGLGIARGTGKLCRTQRATWLPLLYRELWSKPKELMQVNEAMNNWMIPGMIVASNILLLHNPIPNPPSSYIPDFNKLLPMLCEMLLHSPIPKFTSCCPTIIKAS